MKTTHSKWLSYYKLKSKTSNAKPKKRIDQTIKPQSKKKKTIKRQRKELIKQLNFKWLIDINNNYFESRTLYFQTINIPVAQ